MPYKSNAQRKFFHANEKELEKKGVDVKEWDKESKGKKLPEKVVMSRGISNASEEKPKPTVEVSSQRTSPMGVFTSTHAEIPIGKKGASVGATYSKNIGEYSSPGQISASYTSPKGNTIYAGGGKNYAEIGGTINLKNILKKKK
jgi:hypothetical protein